MTSLQELIDDPWFAFEGDVRVKQLLPPVVPEPDRPNLSADTCRACAQPDEEFVWTTDRWRLRRYGEPSPIPGIVLLETREHLDTYAEMSDELLAELGPVTAKVERAILGLGGVGRVHLARYGDGGAHFHQWFFPRPLGALQLRASMLPVWLDVLPPVDPAVETDMYDRLAAALRDAG